MKIRHKLAAAAVIGALHAGLVLLLLSLSPVAQWSTTTQVDALPRTVMVLLAPLPPARPDTPPRSTRPPREAPARTASNSAAVAPTAVMAPINLLAPQSPVATTNTAPSAAEAAPAPLNLGGQALHSAVREADRNSLRRLALQSGKIELLETEKAHPIAMMAAEASEPRCPPAIQMRESVGPQGYALTPDRTSECERERAARVRAKALAR